MLSVTKWLAGYLPGDRPLPDAALVTGARNRWILRLQPYHLKIQFIKGSDNHLADLLSRSGEMMEMKANATSVVLSDFLSGDGVY